MSQRQQPAQEAWPSLPFQAWADTCHTLQMWTQIVGKIKLALAPRMNHWWQIPLYVSSCGLTTAAMPYDTQNLTLEFNFIDHVLEIRTSRGIEETVKLAPRSVADFYGVPNVADWVMREAYSHELSSAGWWPGSQGIDAAFYSYAYPEPAGYRQALVAPEAAYYHQDLREFILPYEAVRQAAQPDEMLMAFLQSSYEAATELGNWDRTTLERQ